MEWDKAYDDIFAINKRIANSEAIQKAKNLKPVVNTPASPPTGVPPGFSSKGNPEKMEYSPLPEGRIPLLPLRFALSNEAILKTRNKDNPYPNMPEIGNNDGYVITRIRRGYVYVYYPDEKEPSKKWEVFRYETGRDDANSREARDDTDERPFSPAYSFTKYDIKSVADKMWLFDRSNGATSTIPVRADQKRLYIAYSEFRWPCVYFNELEKDEGLCVDDMTQVVHDAPNDGQQTAFSELYNLSEYFYEAPFDVEGWKKENEKLDANIYAFEGLGPDKLIDINDIRYTQILPEYIPKAAWGSAFNDDRAKIIVLKDPLADQLDLNVYSVFLAKWLEVYIGIRHYPLVTGNFIKGIKEERIKIASNVDSNGKAVEEGLWDSITGYFTERSLTLDDELTPNFDSLYSSLTSKISENENSVGFVILNNKQELVNVYQNSSLNKVCDDLCFSDSKSPSYSLEKINQVLDYRVRFFSRAYEGVANSNVGNQYLDAVFNNTVPKTADGTPFTYFELIDRDFSLTEYTRILKIGEGLSGAISGGFNYNKNLVRSIGRFLSAFKYPLVQGYRGTDKAVHKFVSVFFSSKTIKVNYLSEVTDAFADIHSGGDIKKYRDIMDAWRNEASTRSKTGEFRQNPYAFEKPIDFLVVKPKVDLNSRPVNNLSNIPFEDIFSGLSNSFSFFAAALTVADNVTALNKEMTSKNHFVNVMLHPATQILSAALDVGAAVIGMQQNSMAFNVKGKVVGNILGSITSRAVDTTTKSGLSKVGIAVVGSAAFATILIAGASLWDSIEKEDKSGIIGNSMWLASPMLISTAMYNLGKDRAILTLLGASLPWAWVNIFGYILLFSGFVVLFFQRNDLQTWVRNSYWGTNENILDKKDRPLPISVITGHYESYLSKQSYLRVNEYQNKFYEKDIARLYQLSSYVKLEDNIKKDSKIGVVSNLIYDEKSLEKFNAAIELADAPVGKPIDYVTVVNDVGAFEFLSKDRAYLNINKAACVLYTDKFRNRSVYIRVKLFYKDVNFTNSSNWLSLELDKL